MSSPDEKKLQRFVLKRFQLALRGRPLNWLARKSGVRQSTLFSQTGGPSGEPNFSLSVLSRIAPVLDKPVRWFLPPEDGEGEPDLEVLRAFHEITMIVDRVRDGEPLGSMPDATARAHDQARHVLPRLPSRGPAGASPGPQDASPSHTPGGKKTGKPAPNPHSRGKGTASGPQDPDGPVE